MATTFAFLVLRAAIFIGYPNGSTPKLQGYCCAYCEHKEACVKAAVNSTPGAVLPDSVCNICGDQRRKYENYRGHSVSVPIAPFDTWTNVAYIVIGLLPFAQRIRTSTFSTLFSVFTIALGFGSGLFHAGGSVTGQLADMVGIFLVFGLIGAHAIQILLRQKNDLLLIVLLVVLVIIQFYLRHFSGNVTALLTIGLIIVVPLLIRTDDKSLRLKILFSAIIFAIAETFRQLDPYLCNKVAENALFFGEQSKIQAHGLWHVVSAIGIGYVFWMAQEIMAAKQQSGEIQEFIMD
ncbi:MAG: ceramidase domain-containing protein [Cytophagales bacterium]|nr:ceramidase domain-containing protein [Cytophagales bacterium]